MGQQILCSDLVQLEWHNAAGRNTAETAILEAISPSTACLQSDTQIPVSSVVRIRRGAVTLKGIVKECTFQEFGYFVDVEFLTGYRWSVKLFRPEHMFDPESLGAMPKPRVRAAG